MGARLELPDIGDAIAIWIRTGITGARGIEPEASLPAVEHAIVVGVEIGDAEVGRHASGVLAAQYEATVRRETFDDLFRKLDDQSAASIQNGTQAVRNPVVEQNRFAVIAHRTRGVVRRRPQSERVHSP